MNKIFQQMQDPSWWFGVVVVGLLLSVAGTFLARYIENFLKRRSEKVAVEKQKADEEQRLIAQALAANPTIFIVFLHFTQRVLTFAIASGAMAVFTLYFGALVSWSPVLKLIIFAIGFTMAIITVMFFSILNERIPVEFSAHRIYAEKIKNRVAEAMKESAGQ